MVFIGNPRRETNRVGGDRIILRSMHSKLHLQHTCSILSIEIEVVEVGVVRVVIPNIFLLRGACVWRLLWATLSDCVVRCRLPVVFGQHGCCRRGWAVVSRVVVAAWGEVLAGAVVWLVVCPRRSLRLLGSAWLPLGTRVLGG